MKKQLRTGILIVASFLAPLMMRAETATELAETISNFNGGGTGSLTAIAAGDTVTVTGTLTDVTTALGLNIDAGVTVLWQASISTIADDYPEEWLIGMRGSGAFEVSTGGVVAGNLRTVNDPDYFYALISSYEATTITVSGTGKVEATGDGSSAILAYGNVEVSGGEVSCPDTSIAIIAAGENSTVTVSGGIVSGGNPIYADGDQSNVIISDAGKLQGESSGIYTLGNAEVRGGEVSSDTGSAIYLGGSNTTATISGGTVSTATGNAVLAYDKNSTVIVSGTGKVQATGDEGKGIYTPGNVEISGGEVSSTTGLVIYAVGVSSTITVNGGLVFSYGNVNTGLEHMIYAPANPTGFKGTAGTGVVIAWNQAAGNTSYAQYATTDISQLPEAAIVQWGKSSSSDGIAYTNGANTGFIPLEVTVAGKTAIETVGNAPFHAYGTDNGLRVESAHSELITIYSATGALLYSTMKDAGSIEVPSASLPGSVFIIKGSISGAIKVVR